MQQHGSWGLQWAAGRAVVSSSSGEPAPGLRVSAWVLTHAHVRVHTPTHKMITLTLRSHTPSLLPCSCLRSNPCLMNNSVCAHTRAQAEQDYMKGMYPMFLCKDTAHMCALQVRGLDLATVLWACPCHCPLQPTHPSVTPGLITDTLAGVPCCVRPLPPTQHVLGTAMMAVRVGQRAPACPASLDAGAFPPSPPPYHQPSPPTGNLAPQVTIPDCPHPDAFPMLPCRCMPNSATLQLVMRRACSRASRTTSANRFVR